MGVLLASILGGCGNAGSGTVAKEAQGAASTVASQAQGKLKDATSTASDSQTTTTASNTGTATKTVTSSAPVRTTTQTDTATASAPAHTTSIENNTTGVQVNPTSTTAAAESGGGLPWWGWALIGLGVLAVAIATFLLGRHRGGAVTSSGPDGRPGGLAAGPGRPPAPPVAEVEDGAARSNDEEGTARSTPPQQGG